MGGEREGRWVVCPPTGPTQGATPPGVLRPTPGRRAAGGAAAEAGGAGGTGAAGGPARALLDTIWVHGPCPGVSKWLMPWACWCAASSQPICLQWFQATRAGATKKRNVTVNHLAHGLHAQRTVHRAHYGEGSTRCTLEQQKKNASSAVCWLDIGQVGDGGLTS